MSQDSESLRLEMLDEASLTRQPDEVFDIISKLGEGSYFGEMGAVAKGPRTASVRAIVPVHAFVLEANEVQEMMAASPEAGQLVVGEATTCRFDCSHADRSSTMCSFLR